jgi:protein-S-isoprenylcysteine O-methyltransferase Ste14
MKGKILVTIQFTCLALLMIVTNWFTLPWWAFLILGISGILAFWAMAVMKLGNFNIVPYPVVNGNMVTAGPYSVIRHPMYTSIFIFAVAVLAGQFDYKKLIISFVLIVGLVLKMVYEEGLLRQHFPDYKSYMQKTNRVIPFVW